MTESKNAVPADAGTMARQIHSLRVRVLGTVAVGSVLLVALFVWIGSFTLDRFIVAQSDGRLLDAAHRTAALIERVLTDRQREAAVIASHPAVVGLLRGGGDARALAELARTLDFADLTVVNPRGAMIATNGALVARLRGDSGWWQPAVIDGASGAVAQLDSAGEQVYLVLTTPVRDAATSRPIGALRAVSPLDNVQSALRRASIGSGIRTDLIDATGHIIVSSAGPSRLAMIGGYEALGGAAADSVFNFDEGPGSRRRATMLFLHGGQWRILTHADRRALVAPTRAARRVLFVGALLMLGALAAGLYAATRYVLRRVSEPAMALAGIAEAVAGGDLSVNVANVARADGEIDRLRRATDAMIRELRRMASAMRGAAQESAAMSTQITGGTEQMSAAAQEMAQTSNDLSRQAGEMAAVIRAAAADTTRLREISARLTGGAHEGVARNAALRAQAGDSRTRLDASIEAIENLAVEVQTSATAVEALAVASEEIRAFVTLVHKVAKQSKLLALNAAMEAARAGEQGQGFAVVATEVRRLATNSTEAAERTEILVRDIIARIEESRGASAQTVGTVHTVLAATRHGIQSFGRIEQAVHDAEQWTAQTERDATESQALVDSIGQRLDSLARGIDQFAAAMEEVAASSQEQSASTEQIAAAAQALAQAADRLTRLVSIFRLGDEMAATEVHPVRRTPAPRKTKELVG